MLPLLLLVAVASAASIALPVQSPPSIECAACQLAAHMFRSQKAVEVGKEHLISQKAVEAHCTKISSCNIALTHCQVIDALAALPVPGLNSSSLQGQHMVKAYSVLLDTAAQCKQNPHMSILDGQPGVVQCTMCFLIYYFFQYMSTAVLQMPLLNVIPTVIFYTCSIVQLETHIQQQALCAALLEPGALNAILQGIQDSMGSFYYLIAQQGMGCPSYQTLFGTC